MGVAVVQSICIFIFLLDRRYILLTFRKRITSYQRYQRRLLEKDISMLDLEKLIGFKDEGHKQRELPSKSIRQKIAKQGKREGKIMHTVADGLKCLACEFRIDLVGSEKLLQACARDVCPAIFAESQLLTNNMKTANKMKNL